MKQFPAAEIITPIPDDVQEMKVLTHTDSSQFGGGLGGTINLITKSGTNQFHGGAWEFWRGSQFARCHEQSEWSLAGLASKPVWRELPAGQCCCPTTTARIARSSMEAMKGSGKRSEPSRSSWSPLRPSYTGDFSALLAKGIQLYNPFTANRDPFPNNQIPSEHDRPEHG